LGKESHKRKKELQLFLQTIKYFGFAARKKDGRDIFLMRFMGTMSMTENQVVRMENAEPLKDLAQQYFSEAENLQQMIASCKRRRKAAIQNGNY